jgi:2-polyprenyl-3-methyl-5-hydroxy-6-metoxy-1,4-benzoquinol methylase
MNNFNKAYIGKRNDILKHIPIKAKYILDIGCSIGTLGRQIKNKNKCHVTGVELSNEMAKEAAKYLDKVIIGDVETSILNDINDNKFECIILADIVEHLNDPWKLIIDCHRILKKDGIIIASIPNIKHFSTIYNLIIKGYWPYRERGIHDKTHLRFFTLKNIKELFKYPQFIEKSINRNYRIIESPNKINKLSKIFSILPIRNFFVFQYVVVYKKNNSY